MNTNSLIARCAVAIAAAALVWIAPPLADAQHAGNATNLIPLIVMDQVPLNDAIKNLARQAALNYILDPRLSSVGPDGRRAPQPTVNVRWENLSAKEALDRVLKEHGLLMVENPVTSVARITFTNQITRRVEGSLLGSDTNAVIPLIVMNTVPLDTALKNLAQMAQVEAVIDPNVSGAAGGVPPPEVSIRWEKLTARQALLALCENYDLVLVKDSAANAVRIKPRFE